MRMCLGICLLFIVGCSNMQEPPCINGLVSNEGLPENYKFSCTWDGRYILHVPSYSIPSFTQFGGEVDSKAEGIEFAWMYDKKMRNPARNR